MGLGSETDEGKWGVSDEDEGKGEETPSGVEGSGVTSLGEETGGLEGAEGWVAGVGVGMKMGTGLGTRLERIQGSLGSH